MHTEDSITFGYEGNKLTLLPNLHSWNNDLVEVYKDSHVMYLEVFNEESYMGIELELKDMKVLRDYFNHKIELLENN